MASELSRRVASACVMAAVVLVATWYGGAAFRIIAAGIAILIFYEWSTIVTVSEARRPVRLSAWLAAVVAALLILFAREPVALVVALVGGIVVAGWSVSSGRAGWLGAGVIYAGFSGVALASIRGDGTPGLIAMLFVFAVVWATDIAAYFCGRFFGGPKLAPRISPSKTWSGATGGAVAGVIAGTAVAFIAHSDADPWVPLLALILSVASQAGDLFESWVKRRFGVKDSSHLIPGHGGVMDRVDGLVFAAFAAYLIAALLPASLAAEGGAPGFSGRLFAGDVKILSAVAERPRAWSPRCIS